MTLFWLIVLGLSIRYVVKHSKSTNSSRSLPPRRENLRSKGSFEDDFNETLTKIRENRKKMDSGEGFEAYETFTERIYRKELEKMFKPGFQDDPEWQRRSKELRETIERNGRIADEELAELERKES